MIHRNITIWDCDVFPFAANSPFWPFTTYLEF